MNSLLLGVKCCKVLCVGNFLNANGTYPYNVKCRVHKRRYWKGQPDFTIPNKTYNLHQLPCYACCSTILVPRERIGRLWKWWINWQKHTWNKIAMPPPKPFVKTCTTKVSTITCEKRFDHEWWNLARWCIVGGVKKCVSFG